ncbi:MAG: type II toxin-antitoxin system RelE/ParE family toxin [Reyranellaceae bacterium]
MEKVGARITITWGIFAAATAFVRIRKSRWAVQARGKNGGIRVIYYWARQDGRILMLLAYPKSRKDTLTSAETATLRRLVKEL